MSVVMTSAGSSNGMGGTSSLASSSSRYGRPSYELHDGPSPNSTSINGRSAGEDDAAAQEKAKKANPLVDLIETETAYVSELGKIIKKVASAWSRSNFPPAELDTMFRNVESIYRINRSFLKSLKEIGPNPSSPRALGDLLMRWVDDMESPYQRYCDNYFTDFDSWPTVQGNPKLPGLLEAASEPSQADGTPVIYSDKKRKPGQVWTLDQLFGLPQTRLKYYKKLYARLLKSTQEGRSDHRLLVGANERLDDLLERSKNRISMSILDDGPIPGGHRQSGESSMDADTTGNTRESTDQNRVSSSTSMSGPDSRSTGPSSIIREETKPSFSSVVYPTQQESVLPAIVTPIDPPRIQTSSSTSSRATSTASLEDLEVRLDTSRTLDIFTMKPKKCQLRMNPPGIPFKRELRKAADVMIYFTPSSTGQEIILRRAHLFLLTDLFLICERMSPSERAQRPNDPADMWLLYPPLAGKHLRVSEDSNQPNTFTLMILKKEKLIVNTESREAKEDWIRQLEDCQKFGASMGLKVKTDAITANSNLSPALTSPSSAPHLNGINGSSPSISVTRSPTTDHDSPITARASGEENTLIRDVTKMLDGNQLFSPHDSIASSLDRGNSFNSFVKPLNERSQSPGLERMMPSTSSPALSSAFSRSPEPMNRPSPPPLIPTSSQQGMQPGMILSPSMSGLASPPNALSPRPIMNGRPPFPPNPNAAPPMPNVPPPPHLINNANGNWNARPPQPRPSPPQNPQSGPGMYGVRPMNPQMPFGQPNGAPNGMFGKPMPPRPGQFGPQGGPLGMGRPQMPNRPPSFQQRDMSRRPSAPDLHDQHQRGPQGPRRSSGDGKPPLRSRSASSSASGPPRLPSDFLKNTARNASTDQDYSPPSSPTKPKGPKSSTVAAQMRCRLYLKQSHAQWKALGNARLKLYHILPEDIKQLVVENDKKPTPLISSIILPDGVERVGKVGVAVELSDNGSRTGIIYMLHLRSEESAFALFGQLLEGSDRTVMGSERDAL